MSYKDDLLSIQWVNRRKEILQRDYCCCQHCNNLSVVKNVTKISKPVILNLKDHYKIVYLDSDSTMQKDLFLKKSQTVLNPLYEQNIVPSDYELYKHTIDSIDIVIAIKEQELDLESVLEATNKILKEKGIPLDRLDSPNFISLKRLNEQKKHQRWVVVPGLNIHHN